MKMFITFLTQLKKLYKYKNLSEYLYHQKMLSTVDKNNKFSFEAITADDIPQQIKHLDINKSTQESDITAKLVKHLDNLIFDYLQENFNIYLKRGTFFQDFKKALAHPTQKKECKA